MPVSCEYFQRKQNNLLFIILGLQNSRAGNFVNYELMGDCLNTSDLNNYSLPPMSTSSPLKPKQKFESALDDVATAGCIQEIDKFLNYSAPHNLSVREFQPDHAFGSPSTTITATIEKPTNSLMKLTELWNNPNESSFGLQEERLRRQHLEKSVQGLQTKLLEYQQKMAVALKVDEDKNQVIDKLLTEKTQFINTLAHYEQQIQHQQTQLQEQIKSANLVKDLQEKNNFLEQKMHSWTT
jgi:hypothetical protein